MPWIAPLVGVGASLLGNWLNSRQSAEQKQANQGLLSNMQQGQQTANTLQPYGTGFLNTAQQGIGSSMDYWSKLLSGNRGEMMSAMAPEVNRINAGYDQNKRSLLQFAPRGGGQAGMLASAPYKEQQDINSLFQTLRPQAAQQMGNLGLQAGGLGNQTFSNLLNALAGSSGAASSILSKGQTQQMINNQAGQQWGNMGYQLGSSLAPWLTGSGNGGSNGGSGGSSMNLSWPFMKGGGTGGGPYGIDQSQAYDKWGNPLFHQDSWGKP